MKSIITIVLCALSVTLFANPNVIFYYEYGPEGYTVFADNEEVCPVYAEFDFTLRNLRVVKNKNNVFTIPAKAVKFKVTDLAVVNALEDYSFKYTAKTYYGDPNQTDYDVVYKYHLPFKKGMSYEVSQGYNGTFSHQDKYAIDFDMPIGSEIHAARGGIVVNVVQENTMSCPSQECAKYNNFILIYHSDGTFAEYGHIKENGAVIKKGDKVKTGQLIGFSGNVGWSSRPHLHFEVFLPKLEERETFKTNFLKGDGSDYSLLVEKQRYHRDY